MAHGHKSTKLKSANYQNLAIRQKFSSSKFTRYTVTLLHKDSFSFLCRFCFAQNCHESGLINDVEWSVYCDWHSFLIKYLHLEFDGFIYLKSTPEVGITYIIVNTVLRPLYTRQFYCRQSVVTLML